MRGPGSGIRAAQELLSGIKRENCVHVASQSLRWNGIEPAIAPANRCDAESGRALHTDAVGRGNAERADVHTPGRHVLLGIHRHAPCA